MLEPQATRQRLHQPFSIVARSMPGRRAVEPSNEPHIAKLIDTTGQHIEIADFERRADVGCPCEHPCPVKVMRATVTECRSLTDDHIEGRDGLGGRHSALEFILPDAMDRS